MNNEITGLETGHSYFFPKPIPSTVHTPVSRYTLPSLQLKEVLLIYKVLSAYSLNLHVPNQLSGCDSAVSIATRIWAGWTRV